MAWSSQLVTAVTGQSNYLTWQAADMPMLVVPKIPAVPTTYIWSNADEAVVGGTTTGTDRTDLTAPARWAFDGYVDLKTKHSSGTTDDVWYYVFDLGSLVTFDVAAIIGHNIGTIGGATVTVEIADNGPFSTNLQTIATWTTPSNDDRLIDIELQHAGGAAREYTAQYVRFKFSKTGTNITPEIGELYLGKRYQLQHRPKIGYDEDSLRAMAEIAESEGGLVQKTLRAERGFTLNADLMIGETARATDIKNWFRYGGRSFLWIWEPNSAPASYNFMIRTEDELAMPSTGWIERSAHLQGIEQGPESYYLDQE